jgi:hypothetical protein
VQRVYCDGDEKDEKDGGVAIRKNLTAQYKKATKEFEKLQEEKKRRAKKFRIIDPENGVEYDEETGKIIEADSLISIFTYEAPGITENEMSSSVRDTAESLEVILVREIDNQLHLLKQVAEGTVIPTDDTPPKELAKLIKQCSVNLPYKLSNPGTIDKTIDAIEGEMDRLGYFDKWQESSFLRGELVIVLDDNAESQINLTSGSKKCRVKYSDTLGLQIAGENHIED